MKAEGPSGPAKINSDDPKHERNDKATGLSTDTLEKVLERLATTEKSTIVVELSRTEKCVSCQALETKKRSFARSGARGLNVEGRIHVARKRRPHDKWDPPIPVYHPYGPGDEFIDD